MLGLRDILDEPAQVLAEWEPFKMQKRIAEYYDAVIVYGERTIFDPVSAYHFPTALAGRRYVRTVNKNESAEVFVSFVGAPKLSAGEIAELKRRPPFIAESRSVENLPRLFKEQLIALAAVSRFQFPSPGPDNPQTPKEWFAKRFQVITAKGLGEIPESE